MKNPKSFESNSALKGLIQQDPAPSNTSDQIITMIPKVFGEE